MTQDTFAKLARKKVSEQKLWIRSRALLKCYGMDWAFEFALNVLYAVDQGKLEDVLERFAAHYRAHRQCLNCETTRQKFDYVRERVLQLPTMNPSPTMLPLKPTPE